MQGDKWGEASQATLKSWQSQRARSSPLTNLWQHPHTYSPLAVCPAAAAVAAAAACCTRVVARLTTDATPLLSPLWLLLLNWLYSCAPLWAGACVVAFPPTHFACCVYTHGAVYQPTHQRTRKSRHGFRNTPMAFQTLVINLIMKLKLMNMSRVLA